MNVSVGNPKHSLANDSEAGAMHSFKFDDRRLIAVRQAPLKVKGSPTN